MGLFALYRLFHDREIQPVRQTEIFRIEGKPNLHQGDRLIKADYIRFGFNVLVVAVIAKNLKVGAASAFACAFFGIGAALTVKKVLDLFEKVCFLLTY